MKFKLAPDHKLYYKVGDEFKEVELVQCFPLSHPNEYYSLKDNEGKELELFQSLNDLDTESREVIENYQVFKSFKCKVIGIYHIEEDFGLRNFKVKTNMGDRSFQMPLDEWPKVADDGLIFFEDVFGEKFILESLEFGEKHLKPYV
tara:strand:- start:46917 stop:47354 length:438 start_codon:yes stop_codon:yes gene_type:complete